MSGFFNGAMRSAAALLFILSLLLLVIGLYGAVQTFIAMRSMMAMGGAGPGLGILLQPLVISVSLAGIPYFGAAILWRMDRAHNARPVKVSE